MYIFLLGRPGCGKSTIYRVMVEKFKLKNIGKGFTRVDDFPKLWKIFKTDEETGLWQRCRKTPDGGYKVTDDNVWDDILKEVNSDLLKFDKSEIVFVEFSRPNYILSLKNFSDEILNNSIIIYLDCSFETCWQRNVDRHKRAIAEGTDDHLVSREEMEKTYLYDDKDELLKQTRIPVFVVDSELPGTDHLIEPVEKIIEFIKQKFYSET